MSDPTIDVAVVGGGVIGLAAACAVAARGRTTCVIERLPRRGQEASTHNSGVVHAGIYYPRDSLKAVRCVEGRERLYACCEEHGVPCAGASPEPDSARRRRCIGSTPGTPCPQPSA